MRPNELFDLTRRVVVITGGAGRLGLRHGDVVAGAGGIPVLADVRTEHLTRDPAAVAERFGQQAAVLPVDITDPASVDALVDAVLDRYGRIDVLINNAANSAPVGPSGLEVSRLESM